MRAVLILSILFVSACTTTQKQEHGYLDHSKEVKVVQAKVENPYPECTKELDIVRLDKHPSLQVYIDIEEGGALCKE